MHSLQDYDSRGNRLSATKQNGVVNTYQYDPHGSVVSYGNTAYQYDAFGNQLTDNNTTNPFRYCGEYFDEETGFVYLRNRYYDTTTGRFITEDPAKDGLNWYVYCSNNPVMFVDPLGLTSYVLYTSGEDSDFTEQAQWQKKYLEKSGEEEVFLVEVNTVDDFIKAWNDIEDDTSKVIIYSHGNDRSLILEDGSATNALTINGKNSAGDNVGNIGWLEHKDIDELQILSCNSGNLDAYHAGVGNVATTFSWLITGEVIGYDGNVSFGEPLKSFEKAGASSRLSYDQSAFRNITASYHGGRKYYRDPQGKVGYRNQIRIYHPLTDIDN